QPISPLFLQSGIRFPYALFLFLLFKGLIIVFKYFRMWGFLRELEVPRMDSERSEVYFSMDSILELL
ncbi:hypothetical protein, partial [Bacillus cereus group sp. BfR-BA-01318]|uniref:hypothetical protein n=1 Tax=Bacillus cereus group sp. BfR-BA-01318 TaxID=2920295 RepID=UPI001F55BBF3